MTGTGRTDVLTFLSRNLVILFILLISFAGLLCFIVRALLGWSGCGGPSGFFRAESGEFCTKIKRESTGRHSLAGIPHLAEQDELKCRTDYPDVSNYYSGRVGHKAKVNFS